jgi:membrane protease YdiL (CAAX protease family)
MKRSKLWYYSIIVLLGSWILSYLNLFNGVDFKLEVLGFSFDIIAVIPGLVALFFLKLIAKEKVLSNFVKFGRFSDWLIGIAYPLLISAIIIVVGYLFKFIRFGDAKNIETLIIGIIFDFPLIFLWSIPTLLLIELGWRVFLFSKIAQSTSNLKGMIISSLIWMSSYIFFILSQNHKTIIAFENITYLISIFTLGLFTCWLYLRSNSIWVVVFFQFNWILWNSFFFSDPIFQTNGIFIGKIWLVSMKGLMGAVSNLLFIPFYIIDVKRGRIRLHDKKINT